MPGTMERVLLSLTTAALAGGFTAGLRTAPHIRLTGFARLPHCCVPPHPMGTRRLREEFSTGG